MRRVKGQISGARFQNPENRNQQIRRPFEVDADYAAGCDASVSQISGQPVGSRLELVIRQRLVFSDNGDGFGRAVDLSFE
jgi:hypothetical protein